MSRNETSPVILSTDDILIQSPLRKFQYNITNEQTDLIGQFLAATFGRSDMISTL